MVTLEETGLTYTGRDTVFNYGNLTVSGCADHANDSGGPPPRLAGRTLTFTLGSGSTAQTCSTTSTARTDSTGTASCTISNVNQPQGPIPLTDTFAGDGYYQTAIAPATVNVGPVQTGTTLTVTPRTSDYNDVDDGVRRP